MHTAAFIKNAFSFVVLSRKLRLSAVIGYCFRNRNVNMRLIWSYTCGLLIWSSVKSHPLIRRCSDAVASDLNPTYFWRPLDRKDNLVQCLAQSYRMLLARLLRLHHSQHGVFPNNKFLTTVLEAVHSKSASNNLSVNFLENVSICAWNT